MPFSESEPDKEAKKNALTEQHEDEVEITTMENLEKKVLELESAKTVAEEEVEQFQKDPSAPPQELENLMETALVAGSDYTIALTFMQLSKQALELPSQQDPDLQIPDRYNMPA